MNEYFEEFEKKLIDTVTANEDAIEDYKAGIASLHKQNDEIKTALEEMKKLK